MRLFHAVLNAFFPAFALVFLMTNTEAMAQFTDWERGFIAALGWLVILFIALMQVVFFEYLPKKRSEILRMMLAPHLFALAAILLGSMTAISYILTTGMLYTISVMIGFILVLFMPLFTKKQPMDWSASLPQLLFIVPGIILVYLFLRYLLATEEFIILLPILLGVAVDIRAQYQSIKRGSIYAS